MTERRLTRREEAAKTLPEMPAFLLADEDAPLPVEPEQTARPVLVNVPIITLRKPSGGRSRKAVHRSEQPTLIDLPVVTQSELAALAVLEREEEAPRRFSETAWFMAAVTPEVLEGELVALDYATMDDMTDRYRASEDLPDGVRCEFSLEDSDSD